jgi:predicted metalloprotease
VATATSEPDDSFQHHEASVRWEDFRRSENVEDVRGTGGFSGRFPGRAGRLGLGTVIILGLLGWAFGIDPSVLIGGADILTGGAPSSEQREAPRGTPTDRTGQFVAAVLGDTEDRWKEIFEKSGRSYRPPTLRLFQGATQSACGFAQSAMGPFYVLRISMSISTLLSSRTSSSGFAAAAARHANSLRPTSSRTRLGIMCRTSWEFFPR